MMSTCYTSADLKAVTSRIFWAVTWLTLLASSTVAGPLSREISLSRDRRSVTLDNPCQNGQSAGSGGPSLGLNESARKLRQQANVIDQRAFEAETQTVADFAVPEEMYATKSFLAHGVLGDRNTEKAEFLNSSTRADVLKRHLSHVFNVTTMINHARNDGEIGSAGDDGNSQISILRNKMDEVERELDSLVCDIVMGLKSVNVTDIPNPPPFAPQHPFYRLGTRLDLEAKRAYVLVRDIEKVMEHLAVVYDSYVVEW